MNSCLQDERNDMPLTENDIIRIRQFIQQMESGLILGQQVFATYHDSNLAALPSDPTGNGTTGGWHRLATEASNWMSVKTALKDSAGTWGTPIRVFGLQGTETAGVGLSADIPKLEQITFIGDGSSKVGWTPGTVTYGGSSYAIDVKAVGDGSTDAYIYWDDADGQTSFKTTGTFATAIAANHWMVCLNDSGKAIPAVSHRIILGGLIQGKTVTASKILVFGLDTDGYLQFNEKLPGHVIQEYFDDPNDDVDTRWPSYTGSGERSIEIGGLTGGNFHRVGDNSGDDMRWMIHHQSIPYDESKLYRIRCRIRRTQGTGVCYIGVQGRNGADDAWVNTAGADAYTSGHWFAASAANPDATWTVYTGYFKGRADPGEGGAHTDPSDPGKMHDDVRYFRPAILVNYNGETGIVEIDEYSIDIIGDDAAQAAAEAAQADADTAQGAADSAQADATTGIADAATAQGELDEIAADTKVTPVEKLEAKQRWDAIVVEGTATTGTIPVQATAFGVADTDFDTAYAALDLYLNTTISVFGNMATTTTMTRAAWDTAWKNYYDERTQLLNAIATAAKSLADTAQGAADTAQGAADDAQADATTAIADAATAQADATTAIANAATAQAEADGKIRTFFQDAVPTAENAGDIWFDTNDGLKMHRATSAGDNQVTGGQWEHVDLTIIDGGNITSNTILAASILTYNLTAGNATIANLFVKTAHIDNLNVTTGKINDDATEIVGTGYTAGSLGLNASWQTLASVVVTSDGEPMVITGRAQLVIAGGGGAAHLGLFVGATQVGGTPDYLSAGSSTWYGSVSASFTPGSGQHTIYLKGYETTNAVTASLREIQVVEGRGK